MAALIRQPDLQGLGPFRLPLRIRRLNLSSGQPLGEWHTVTATAVRHELLKDPRVWDTIADLWRKTMTGELADPWQGLALDIARSLMGTKHRAAPTGTYDPPPEVPVSEFDQDGALLAHRPVAEEVAEVKGIISVRQGDYAVDEESVRAARVLTKMRHGPHYFDDDSDLQNLANAAQTEDYGQARRDKLYADFKAAVKGTEEDRGASARAFESVRAIVTGKPDAKFAHSRRQYVNSIVPSADDVQSGGGRSLRRASHDYGTWLQRQPSFKAANGTGALQEATVPNEWTQASDSSAAAKLERVRGSFFALQGDPLLARLFCLVIDVEFDLPSGWEASSEPLYLHLAAEEDNRAHRVTPLVATAAKLQGQAFWPVSVFEAGLSVNTDGHDVKPIAQPALVEQTDGIWSLGVDYPQDTSPLEPPRYDLVSLDIRRAVDSKPDAVDRGQRHLTAGFTILDRGRSEQIARDLALASVQRTAIDVVTNREKPADAVVVLHTEELTVGRRVDVAAVGLGLPVGNATWRSLMNRFVTFSKVGSAVEDALKVLLKDKLVGSAFLDEASFQVATRYMPMLGAGAKTTTNGQPVRSIEAAAEEAIFLWDGSPIGALTGAGDTTSKSPYPFTRELSLPTNQGALQLVPAPLRYGRGYVFGFRSMFLGGGSPSVSESAARRKTSPNTMLPPPVNGVMAPRRFLRHESILSPTLLFPKHLAAMRLGAMGFEQLDQAIVRTGINGDPTLQSAAEAENTSSERGPRYVTVPSRAIPELTMRVLIAPQASFETVERHGLLDTDKPADVLRGGLRDVTFDPIRRKLSGNESVGFPSVVTRKAQALSSEGAEYDREILRPGAAEPGVPVFEAGGTNATPPKGIGYLPDPAAEEMSIKARITGTHQYLDGSITVDLYEPKERIIYPNALPVVVTIKRARKRRDKPATSVSEIFGDSNDSLRWMTSSGDLLSSKPKSGTRVRHLTVQLCLGEDFELEVCCLPKPETFASIFALPETIALQMLRAKNAAVEREKLEALCGTFDLSTCEEDLTKAITGLAGHRLPGTGAIKQAARELLHSMKTRGPIEEISAVRRLRVCHSVNAPCDAPAFGPAPVQVRRPRVSDLSKLGPTPDVSNVPGEKTLLLTGDLQVDLEHVSALEVVVTAVAASGGPIDSKTRSRSLIARRSGRWPTLVTRGGVRKYVAPRHVVGFEVRPDGRAVLPRETVTLFRVDNFPPRATEGTGGGLFGKTDNRLTTLSLAHLHAAALTSTPIVVPLSSEDTVTNSVAGRERTRTIKAAPDHTVADAKARKLELQVIGISRTAETFETAPVYLGLGEPLLNRRQALRPRDQSRTSRPIEVWAPATERPSICVKRKPGINQVIERWALTQDKTSIQALTRRTLTRLWLGREWFSSGEGERLGIVLWPRNYFAQSEAEIDKDAITVDGRTLRLGGFEDSDLGPGGSFVTRWGGDPIRHDVSRQTGMFIPPCAFADHIAPPEKSPHAPRVVPHARMPVRAASDSDESDSKKGPSEPPREFLDVSLLTYDPCFDLDRQEWYVDVDLRPIRASEPRVRFGLVRYQEHAISEELKVSFPIRVDTEVLPQRDLEVTLLEANDGKGEIEVKLVGFGSMDIHDLRVEEVFKGEPNLKSLMASFDLLRRPKVNVGIFHEVTDKTGTRRTHLCGPKEWINVPNKVDNTTLKWTTHVALDHERMNQLGPGTYVAYFEEVDRRMPASYQNEPIELKKLFDESTYRSSGPRFSARVPFLKVPITSTVSNGD
jgi:hypothetical protein